MKRMIESIENCELHCLENHVKKPKIVELNKKCKPNFFRTSRGNTGSRDFP